MTCPLFISQGVPSISSSLRKVSLREVDLPEATQPVSRSKQGRLPSLAHSSAGMHFRAGKGVREPLELRACYGRHLWTLQHSAGKGLQLEQCSQNKQLEQGCYFVHTVPSHCSS